MDSDENMEEQDRLIGSFPFKPKSKPGAALPQKRNRVASCSSSPKERSASKRIDESYVDTATARQTSAEKLDKAARSESGESENFHAAVIDTAFHTELFFSGFWNGVVSGCRGLQKYQAISLSDRNSNPLTIGHAILTNTNCREKGNTNFISPSAIACNNQYAELLQLYLKQVDKATVALCRSDTQSFTSDNIPGEYILMRPVCLQLELGTKWSYEAWIHSCL